MTVLVTLGGSALGRTPEAEIKAAYKNLIDAENRHDISAVREMVWNSPSALFVAKAPVGWHGYWGINDIVNHLHDMYQGTFRIDPIYEEERVVFLTPDIAETYAPVRITVHMPDKIRFHDRSSWCCFGSRRRKAGKWRQIYPSRSQTILSPS